MNRITRTVAQRVLRKAVAGVLNLRISEKTVPLLLLGVCLYMRLTSMSSSLSEVDAANFHNALVYGYDITNLRPHPPGYPIYMLAAWYVYLIVGDSLTALTLLSAISGSLAIVPFYLLIHQLVGRSYAIAGSILFIANPLVWSYSEAALSDIPSMALVILAVWLSVLGKRNNTALLGSFVIMALAVGVRLSNLPLAIIVLIPLLARLIRSKEVDWKLWSSGMALFVITTMAWLIPMVFLGGGGVDQYLQNTHKQWSGAVAPTSAQMSGSATAITILLRLERFAVGYLITYPSTGTYTNSLPHLLLVTPWIFGFALFIISFRLRDGRYLLVVAWLVPILLQSMVIHFLPRYGLPYWPGFLLACMIGYQFLAHKIIMHPMRIEILILLGISSLLIAYGIKYQTPLMIFEGNDVEPDIFPVLVIVLGVLGIGICKGMLRRMESQEPHGTMAGTPSQRRLGMIFLIVPICLCLLAVPQLLMGYRYVSLAHTSQSPSEQMARAINERFEGDEVLACWDGQTHSLLEARIPDLNIAGHVSLDELLVQMRSRNLMLIFTDKCAWWDEITARFNYTEIGRFEGLNPLWVKIPSIRLYLVSSFY